MLCQLSMCLGACPSVRVRLVGRTRWSEDERRDGRLWLGDEPAAWVVGADASGTLGPRVDGWCASDGGEHALGISREPPCLGPKENVHMCT